MMTYKIYVEQTGKTESVHHFAAHTAADALVQAKVFFDWQFNGAYVIHMINPVENQLDQPLSVVHKIKGIAWIHEALDAIKERHSKHHSGECRLYRDDIVLIEKANCPCTLCLCDNIRDYIESQAQKA
jgi:hypothetical protein